MNRVSTIIFQLERKCGLFFSLAVEKKSNKEKPYMTDLLRDVAPCTLAVPY